MARFGQLGGGFRVGGQGLDQPLAKIHGQSFWRGGQASVKRLTEGWHFVVQLARHARVLGALPREQEEHPGFDQRGLRCLDLAQ